MSIAARTRFPRPSQGKASEVPLGQEFACRFVLRDAKIVRADAFLSSWAEALEAAGLRE
jgi:hypothetical protein